jgi:hypothetical protein
VDRLALQQIGRELARLLTERLDGLLWVDRFRRVHADQADGCLLPVEDHGDGVAVDDADDLVRGGLAEVGLVRSRGERQK